MPANLKLSLKNEIGSHIKVLSTEGAVEILVNYTTNRSHWCMNRLEATQFNSLRVATVRLATQMKDNDGIYYILE